MIYKLNEGPITQHIIAKHSFFYFLLFFFLVGGFSFVNFWEKGLFTFSSKLTLEHSIHIF